MDRLFFEVFPTLEVNSKLKELFKGMSVSEVALSADGHALSVYLKSDQFVARSCIDEMEKAICTQLFDEKRTVHIVDVVLLEASQSIQDVISSNWNQLAEEAGRISGRLDMELLRQAVWAYSAEEGLELKIPGSKLLQDRMDIICAELKQIFKEHFGLQISAHITAVHHEEDQREEPEITMVPLGPEEVSVQSDQETAPWEEADSKPTEETPVTEKKAKKQKPAMVYGRSFKQEPVPIRSLQEAEELQAFDCQVISVDVREIKNEKTILTFVGTDYTDSIKTKLFVSNKKLPDMLAKISKGSFLTVCGMVRYDSFDRDTAVTSVFGIRETEDFTDKRHDDAVVKRVELHCHTQMSDMDGISSAKALLSRAHDWGHTAMAVTDHGVLQAFPDVYKFKKSLSKEDPFKPIYGVEGYLVDDLRSVTRGGADRLLSGTFVALDFETTGFSKIGDRIIEIGAVRIVDGRCREEFSAFVDPQRPLPYKITELTGITSEDLKGAPTMDEILPSFLEFIGDSMIIAHNAGFDVGFLEQACRRCGQERVFDYLDTVELARLFLPDLTRFRLDTVAKALGLPPFSHHRASDDARVCGEIFGALLEKMKKEGIRTVGDLEMIASKTGVNPKTLPVFHVVLLAKNDLGRVNLYTLTSKAHLDYFGGRPGRPRIPKSVLNRYRDGLIIGSACSAGELYRAITEGEDEEEVRRIASWYDYLEIQPIGNNEYLLHDERSADIQSEEDLRDINRRIVDLGEKLHKPVCATGDVHFLDPEDEIYRRIIQTGNGMEDADHQPPLFLRTTQEMLDEFAYLGEEKAREVVVDMPQMIADCIEPIAPVRPDKCPPVIEESDKTLTDICYARAHEMYGDPLPDIVQERLERELHSIISNGYAVMYIIAQKLVAKSNEDGYLVGSRGSVGSSFVATMAGITEVNPLSAHYYCPHCHYSEFDSERIRAAGVDCGWDLPDAVCPVCGKPLKKDGYDIPFETFLGFKGNKEPDIDLNFSSDYQSNAHKYTEVLFGEGQTFKAGTIGTIADKTAFGYVKSYFDEKGVSPRKCEIERLKDGCTGIRRGTGQHPGGIVVLPYGENINSFTPVQHPANDMKTDIVTTHFDYHSIDENLLKLDILGHDDPRMIRMLEELVPQLTGKEFKATEVPLDDADVMSLFAGTEALGIKPEDIGGCPLGCMGVPEFGTDFVIQMVSEAKPKTLSDLIKISGLSHGTDVWTHNAQDLIKAGTATLGSCICTRDDIMLYLIGQGVDKELSFKIMEAVRKGRGLTADQEKVMRENGVPEWYLNSCKKIQYMFPKAHASAYVMMAYRIAYCKVNYPLAYYAAFFTIRAKAFSYVLMCHGPEKVNYMIDEYTRRKRGDYSERLSAKEEDTLRDLKIVQEMYARGLEFLPIDIYRSGAMDFRIQDGKLLPPFNSIDGMGEKAAAQAESAAKNGPYLSRQDFQKRSKVNGTIMDIMEQEGLFGDLPEDTQLSLFDIDLIH